MAGSNEEGLTLEEFLKSKTGVQGGVGRRAVSAALSRGYTKAEIEQAGQNIAASDFAGPTEGLFTAAGKIGSTDPADRSYFGDPGDFTGDPSDAAAVQAYHDKQDRYAGGADMASMKISGMTDTEIHDYMTGEDKVNWAATDPNYREAWSGIQTGATNEAITAAVTPWSDKVGELTGDLSDLGGKYNTLKLDYDKLTGNYGQLQQDVAQAAKDAMKIKYTGSTQVRNPSAMGIQAAQGTPFRGSGLAGTAALARPNKGLKIKTLNV